MPVPDVRLDGVTAEESERCVRRTAFYASNWKQMDPIMVGVKRYALEVKDRERIVIDAHVAPLEETKYGKVLSVLGPPVSQEISPAQGDIAFVQAALRGGLLRPGVPVHHLFVGIQDAVPTSDLKFDSLLKSLQILRSTPGYLGAWPKPGFLDILPLRLGGGQPDAYGYSLLPLSLWRRQWGEFSALSFDRATLDAATPQLEPVAAESPAQIRLAVGDLSQAEFRQWVNAMNYYRSAQASRGNTRLMHALSTQLGAPRAAARETAESLLDAKLACPLGGEYELDTVADGLEAWVSTAGDGSSAPPEDYQAPLLNWFRGVQAELLKSSGQIVVHAELDMQRHPKAPEIKLPLFNLFGGKGAGKKKSTPKKTDSKPKTDKGPREF